MPTVPLDETRLKELLKEALTEVLDQRREWFSSVVAEAMEDLALVAAIKEGEASESISRAEIMQILTKRQQ